jgi:hypothetical protein
VVLARQRAESVLSFCKTFTSAGGASSEWDMCGQYNDIETCDACAEAHAS